MDFNKKTKSRAGFEYQVRRAKKCRHERLIINCSNCKDYNSCDIQEKLKKHHSNLYPTI